MPKITDFSVKPSALSKIWSAGCSRWKWELQQKHCTNKHSKAAKNN